MSGAGRAAVTTDDVPDDEARVLDGLRRGDPAAATELVDRYAARAYRIAIAITRNAADAEQVVQDALSGVIRNIDTFRGDAALGSWLYRIVTNAACRAARRTAHRWTEMPVDELLPAFHEDGAPAVMVDDWTGRLDDPILGTGVRGALTAALDDLPPEDRAVVVLRDVEGLSITEAAASLGISVHDARTRLNHARLFLRKRLAAFMAMAS